MTLSAPDLQAQFDRLAAFSTDEWDHNSHYHGFLLRYIPPHCGEALEVGCGTGAFARLLAARCARVLALDLSPEMVRLARERSTAYANVEFRVADARAWEFPAARFDCVASVATLHHLPLAETLSRMRRAVRPGGVLLVLDLLQEEGLSGLLTNVVAAPASVALLLLKRHRLREPAAERAAWEAHGHGDSYPTLAQVRRACAEALPGAQVRAHLLWRYSIVWRAPAA